MAFTITLFVILKYKVVHEAYYQALIVAYKLEIHYKIFTIEVSFKQ